MHAQDITGEEEEVEKHYFLVKLYFLFFLLAHFFPLVVILLLSTYSSGRISCTHGVVVCVQWHGLVQGRSHTVNCKSDLYHQAKFRSHFYASHHSTNPPVQTNHRSKHQHSSRSLRKSTKEGKNSQVKI